MKTLKKRFIKKWLPLDLKWQGDERPKELESDLDKLLWKVAMDSWYEAKSFGPHSFDTYWKFKTEKE